MSNSHSGVHYSHSRLYRFAPLGAALLSITGCEAPLNLDAIERGTADAIQRTDFYQAMASNDSLTVLVGNSGVVLTSHDQGQRWTRVQLPTDQSLIDVDVCPDRSFIALGFDNRVWHADEKAEQWTAYQLPSSEQMMTSACAPDGTWWAAGSFTTLQSSADRGTSWTEQSLDEDAIFTTLQFLGEGRAIVTGEYGLVFNTRDGGESWESAASLPDEFYPHASYFKNLHEGWVGGLNGFIWYTRDGGASWERQETGTEAPIFGFVNGKDGLYALGDNATVLSLRGRAWRTLPTPDQPLYLRAGRMLPNQKLLVAGGRGLMLKVELPKALAASADGGL